MDSFVSANFPAFCQGRGALTGLYSKLTTDLIAVICWGRLTLTQRQTVVIWAETLVGPWRLKKAKVQPLAGNILLPEAVHSTQKVPKVALVTVRRSG